MFVMWESYHFYMLDIVHSEFVSCFYLHRYDFVGFKLTAMYCLFMMIHIKYQMKLK